MRIFRLPDENAHRHIELSRRIELEATGDNALYVCLTPARRALGLVEPDPCLFVIAPQRIINSGPNIPALRARNVPTGGPIA